MMIKLKNKNKNKIEQANKPTLKLECLLISNIVCQQEKELRKRERAKYGSAIFLIRQINNRTIEPAHRGHRHKRLLLEAFYLLDRDEFNLSNSTTGLSYSLELDPYTLFITPQREQYIDRGYINLSAQVWFNLDNIALFRQLDWSEAIYKVSDSPLLSTEEARALLLAKTSYVLKPCKQSLYLQPRKAN